MRWTYLTIVLVALIFTVLATNRETSLVCKLDGDTPTCTKEIFYFDRVFRERTYLEIGNARIRESCDEDGACSEAVIIRTEAWFSPSIEWSDGRPASEVVEEFNAFLARERGSTFQADYSISLWRNFYLWFLGLFVSGLFLYLAIDDWRRS